MYGRKQRFGYQPQETQFVRPSTNLYAYPSYQVPFAYDPRQQYAYEDAYAAEEPSELEVLEYEEQQLIHQQAQILAKRRQIAAEKYRLQAEAAAEQERLRQFKIQQHVQQEGERRRQEWIKQEQILRQHQELAAARHQAHQIQQQAYGSTHQPRQKYFTSNKEAQLEAALREMENLNAYEEAVMTQRKQQASHQARVNTTKVPSITQPTQPKSKQEVEVTNPLDFLFQLFGAQQVQQTQQNEGQYVPSCASRCGSSPLNKKKTNGSNSSNPSSSSSKPQVAKPSSTQTQSKPSSSPSPVVVSAKRLEQIKNRIKEVSSVVSDLISTSFHQLTLRHFGKIDSELMQILLALDNLDSESEDVRVERKALVNKTVSLLDQVDQYKDAYSSSSSSASSDTSSQRDEGSEEDEHEEQEDQLVKEEDIDADSLSSYVEPIAESSGIVFSPLVPINIDDEKKIEENSEKIESSSSSILDNVLLVDDHPTTFASNNDLIQEDDEKVQKDEEENDQIESSLPQTSPLVDEDPFGFQTIKDAVSKKDLESNSVPIQIGSNRKTNVVIESSPSSSSQ